MTARDNELIIKEIRANQPATDITPAVDNGEVAAAKALNNVDEVLPAGDSGALETREVPTIKMEIVKSNYDLVKDFKRGFVKVGIDCEEVTTGGQIMTEGLASCVGFAVWIPNAEKAYVGHFNGIPGDLKGESEDDEGNLYELKDNNELKIFLFGGDNEQLSNELLKRLFDKLISYWPGKINDPKPVFCNGTGATALKLSNNYAVSLPTVTGISIDTKNRKVKLLMPEGNLTPDQMALVHKAYEVNV